jgi:hypothetical protein
METGGDARDRSRAIARGALDGPDELDRGDGGIGDEGPRERRNRELIELLNELRVALPGVQVLFAFLLTVPFSGRLEALSTWQRVAYFATFAGTAVSTALFMAPTSYHRLRFRQGDKERMLRTANRFTIVGIAFLAASIAGAVFLTADLVFGLWFALGMAAVILALLAWAWFLLPLTRRALDGASPDGAEREP